MKIYEVPSDRRYWVVRAEGGHYYDHFTRNGVIALSHLNNLGLPNSSENDLLPDWLTLKNKFRPLLEKNQSLKPIGRLHLSQAKSFIYEMKPADWVITIGAGSVRFGRIVSKPFFDNKPIVVVYDAERGRIVECDMHLRRRVEWGPSIPRRNLPYGLLMSLKANQTVFCVDAKWDAIYHTLYPAFLRDNKLYLSAKIKSDRAIKNHDISTIFKLLDEVEVIGKSASRNSKESDFEKTFHQFIEGDELTITTKAQFHSPGEIWNVISGVAGQIDLSSWAAKSFAAYSLIFGNNKAGFDGIVDLETRRKLWDLVIERIKKNNAQKVVENLQMELPRVDTSQLEDGSKDRQ
jgi:hypothetical protein